MLNCTPCHIPLSQPIHKLLPPPPNSIPNVHGDEILINYQCLISSLTYLAICTCPDITYAAMVLSQFNVKLTHAHLLVAKGVLQYLAGTLNYRLEYTVPITNIPPMVIHTIFSRLHIN